MHLDYLVPAALPVPQDRPFTYAEAQQLLGGRAAVRELLRRGLLTSPLRGVYRAAGTADTLDERLAALRLVLPTDAVICDRTAAWVHGADMALAPGSHLTPPPLDVYLPRNARLANGLVHGGSRRFRTDEVLDVGGLAVTTPSRTACDLGRLLRREPALAALDSLARATQLCVPSLESQVPRHRGQRGVIQLRQLVPLIDARSQSAPESILRLRWLDCHDLPRPTPQWQVATPAGQRFLDLAVPALKYAAEYDGEAFHTGRDAAHDAARRAWFRGDGWIIDVLRKDDMFGPRQRVEHILRDGVRRARQAVA